MTDPKLREARIARAKELADKCDWLPGTPNYQSSLLIHLCDLIETDWRPEPEVDAVTLAFRAWMKTQGYDGAAVDAGAYDECRSAQAFRAGHAHGQANCADVKRMDWLGGQWVEVVDVAGRCFRHGIFVREPGPLRTKIDRAMESGQ